MSSNYPPGVTGNEWQITGEPDEPRRDPTQSADGHAHLAYFDVRSQASFVWNGDDSAIEVSIGGYAEPVSHEIPAPDLSLMQWSAVGVLGVFEDVCKAHADTLVDF